jgi:hypothetical protein
MMTRLPCDKPASDVFLLAVIVIEMFPDPSCVARVAIHLCPMISGTTLSHSSELERN